MKLLLKVYLENLNPYDTIQMLELFISNIVDKYSTKIYIMTNESDFDFNPYDFYYLNETSIPKMINHKLNELNWDIVLPIYKPCIIERGFDSHIKKIYEEKFPELDGVLWLNDGIQDNISTYSVIGKNYYNKFGYIYNPAYKKTNFEKEFTEVVKKKNKFYYTNNIRLKSLSLKSDDDNIYELRKKLNFGI